VIAGDRTPDVLRRLEIIIEVEGAGVVADAVLGGFKLIVQQITSAGDLLGITVACGELRSTVQPSWSSKSAPRQVSPYSTDQQAFRA
jgi:hypothetical protein